MRSNDNDIKTREIGLHIPEILLPRQDISLTKWAVVACDQYTAQPEYWEEANEFVGDEPSALRLIFPEAFLAEADSEKRIADINKTMKTYINERVLEPAVNGFVYLERIAPDLRGSRKGLVVAVDLEAYDYESGSKSLIRATEGTIKDRLPPRMRIRENAVLETPHIMMLIDDKNKTVIEPLAELKANMRKLYDFDLMLGAGRLTGWAVEDSELSTTVEAIYVLRRAMLYAVGDGNHSLATAKACWDAKKEALSAVERENHPARFALVELINLHDDALVFEPIHRALFTDDIPSVLSELKVVFESRDMTFDYDSRTNIVSFGRCPALDVLDILQPFLDALTKNGNVDYIHGFDSLKALCAKPDCCGFKLEPIDKNELFQTVQTKGALQKKSFSMGEANEKRFYLECRKIAPT